MPAKVAVVGSVNIDMVVRSQRIPAVGETVTGGAFVMAHGGKGANQAVAAARLGAQVTLVANVGNDIFGHEALEGFRHEGIVTDFVGCDASQATGVALILVDHRGANLISVAPGANFTLSAAQVRAAAPAIAAAKVLLVQLETSLDTVRTACQIARDAGVAVVLDPAPAAPLDDDLLRLVSVIKPNETEAAHLTGISVSDRASAEAAGRALLARGAQNAIITLGAEGSVLVTQGETLHVPSVPIQAVDTTAAGDAYSGGLAFRLAAGDSLRDAVAYASLVGAMAATKLGAQPSMPTAPELAAFAAQHGRKI